MGLVTRLYLPDSHTKKLTKQRLPNHSFGGKKQSGNQHLNTSTCTCIYKKEMGSRSTRTPTKSDPHQLGPNDYQLGPTVFVQIADLNDASGSLLKE